MREHVIDGEKKWGILVAEAPAGHRRFESFETKEMVESERQCDTSQTMFAEEALSAARKALSGAHQLEQRNREKRCVHDLPKPAPVTAEHLDQFAELLQSLGNSRSGPTAAIVGKDDDTMELWTAPQDLCCGEDGEGSLASPQDRDPDGDLDFIWDQRRTRLEMAGSFVPKDGACKAPGKQGPAVTAGKQATRKRPQSAGSAPPPKRASTAPSGHSEEAAMDHYDSRIGRALAQYNEGLETAKTKLDAVSFKEGLEAGKSPLTEAITSRHKAIAEITRSIKGLETKIKRAKGLPFQEAHQKFLALSNRCKHLGEFNQRLP